MHYDVKRLLRMRLVTKRAAYSVINKTLRPATDLEDADRWVDGGGGIETAEEIALFDDKWFAIYVK